MSELRNKFKKRDKLKVPLSDNSITINGLPFENVDIHSIEKLSNAKIIKDYNITFSIDMGGNSSIKYNGMAQPYRLYEYSYKTVRIQFELSVSVDEDGIGEFLAFEGKLVVLKVSDGIMLFSISCHQTHGVNLGTALKMVKETLKKEEAVKNRKINRKFTF